MRSTFHLFISFYFPLTCFVTVGQVPGWHPLLFMRNTSPDKLSELWTSVDQAQEPVSFRNLTESGVTTFRSKEIEKWDINPPDKVRLIYYNEQGDNLWAVIFNTTGTDSMDVLQSERIIDIQPNIPYNQLLIFQNEIITDGDDHILMMDLMLNAATQSSNKKHAFVFSPISPIELPFAGLPLLRPCVSVGVNSVEQHFLSKMTLEICLHRCVLQGFAYSLIQNGNRCSCINERPATVTSTDCGMTCTGDSTQICGGVDASTLLQNTHPDTSMCFNKSTLNIGLVNTIVNMTLEECVSFCYQNHFEYAAVQDGDSCGCVSMKPDMPDGSLCNIPCIGNALQNCGGDNAIRVMPVDVSEWAMMECTTQLLDFSGLMGDQSFTQESCVYNCYNKGFVYAAIQKGDQCVCLNEMPSGQLVLNGCTEPCPGDPTQFCGGKKNKFVIPTRRDVSCIRTTDVAQNASSLTNVTVQKCIYYCYGLGYAHAGVMAGTQCQCYEAPPIVSERIPCETVCSGDTSQLCGGLDSGRFFPTKNNIELLAPFSDSIFNGNFSDFPVEITTAQIDVSVDGVFYMDLIEIDLLSAGQQDLPIDVNIFYGSKTCEHKLRWYGPNMTYQLDQETTVGENIREHTGPLKVGCLRIKIIPAATVNIQPTVTVRLYGAQPGTFIHAPILAVDGYWEPDEPRTSSIYSTYVATSSQFDSTSVISVTSSTAAISSNLCPCDCTLYSQIMHRQTQYENLTAEEIHKLIKEKAEIVKNEVAAAINISELSSTVRKYISASDNRTSAQTMGYVLGIALLSVFFGSIVLLDIVAFSREFIELKNKIGIVWHKQA